jgi:hypothetical protein
MHQQILLGWSNQEGRKCEGKRPLKKPRCRWENNIIMDLKEIGWEGLDWIYVAYDRDQ